MQPVKCILLNISLKIYVALFGAFFLIYEEFQNKYLLTVLISKMLGPRSAFQILLCFVKSYPKLYPCLQKAF